jgi:hypothetical protein
VIVAGSCRLRRRMHAPVREQRLLVEVPNALDPALCHRLCDGDASPVLHRSDPDPDPDPDPDSAQRQRGAHVDLRPFSVSEVATRALPRPRPGAESVLSSSMGTWVCQQMPAAAEHLAPVLNRMPKDRVSAIRNYIRHVPSA